MSTSLIEKQEKIEQIITKLIEESANGKLVVVEGAKDTQALRKLGVKGSIVTIKTGGKSFIEASAEIEQRGARDIILLLDFDRRGKEGTRRLKQDLERAKIKVDMRFWHGFQALVGREVQCIEGLSAYLATLEKKIA